MYVVSKRIPLTNSLICVLCIVCVKTLDLGKVLSPNQGNIKMIGNGQTIFRMLKEIAYLRGRYRELESQCRGGSEQLGGNFTYLERFRNGTTKRNGSSTNIGTNYDRHVNVRFAGKTLSQRDKCLCNNRMTNDNHTILRMLQEIAEIKGRYQQLDIKYRYETKELKQRYRDMEVNYNKTKAINERCQNDFAGLRGQYQDIKQKYLNKIGDTNKRYTKVECLNGKEIKDCRRYKVCNATLQSGSYDIYIDDNTTFTTQCDMSTEGGGWTVIFSRSFDAFDGRKTWKEYKEGFGSVTMDFWIGNDKIHKLTEGRPSELLFKFKDWKGLIYCARYENMTIGAEKDLYTLRFDRKSYNGTAGDSLYFGGSLWENTYSMPFSTWDQDNDMWDNGNCAELSGWWYNDCGGVGLTKANHIWMSPQEKPREIQTSVVMIRAMSEWYTV